MANVTGVVEAFNCPDKFGKASLLVNGGWYNTNPDWLDTKPNKGDTVSFDDGGRKYIKGLRVLSSGGGVSAAPSGGNSYTPAGSGGTGFPMGPTDKSRAINRQNALTNAVNFCKETTDPNDIIDVARMFEAYTTGDLDVLEAEAAMEAMSK